VTFHRTSAWYECYLKIFHALLDFNLTAVLYLSFALVARLIRILLYEERMNFYPDLSYLYADGDTLQNI